MTELLDTNQMLANEYEPKRKFRWILEIDGIDGFTAQTAARPAKEHEATEIHYMNQRRYVAGKYTWQPLEITLYDPIAPSAQQKVMQWLRLVHEDLTGRMGYAEMYKRNFSLKMLSPVGNVVEKWNIIGAWPMSVNPGDLDYSSSELVTISISIRYDEARLEF